ncbi:MAG: hypothetical protein HDR88_05155 [Bacteroides sp.]|nr:hypothetical protein [Bacteroides sp.]
MTHIYSILFLEHKLRIISVLVIAIAEMIMPSLLKAINAAPNVSDFPNHLLSLPNDVLLRKAEKYRSSEHSDSALLCYMIVAQREFDTSSPERIRQGLSARFEAGVLYYSPFYDYGKAYSLFQDTYTLAKEQDNSEFMGLAANIPETPAILPPPMQSIGNNLSMEEVAYAA